MKKKLMIGIVIGILFLLVASVFIILNKEEQENPDTLNQNNGYVNNHEEESSQNEAMNMPTINEQTSEKTNANNSKKVLVIYYSRSGNTEQIAKYIKEVSRADIVKLETVKTYPSNYNEMLEYAQEEQRNGERPELKNKNINIADYDTIFLGYPIWWGEIATPIYTFLDEYDLSGKKIAPFVTSGSSGISGTLNDIKKAEPKAEILEAISITSSNLSNYKSLIDNWL